MQQAGLHHLAFIIRREALIKREKLALEVSALNGLPVVVMVEQCFPLKGVMCRIPRFALVAMSSIAHEWSRVVAVPLPPRPTLCHQPISLRQFLVKLFIQSIAQSC